MRESWNALWAEADTWWKKILYALGYLALFAIAFIVCAASGMFH